MFRFTSRYLFLSSSNESLSYTGLTDFIFSRYLEVRKTPELYLMFSLIMSLLVFRLKPRVLFFRF